MQSDDTPLMTSDGPTCSTSPLKSGTPATTPATSQEVRRSIQERRASGAGSLRPSLTLTIGDIMKGTREEQACPENPVQAQTRPWHMYSAVTSNAALRVMSYNVLASRYTSTDKYPDCPTWALALPYRLANIVHEIQELNPDIVCVQELSLELYNGDMSLKMAELGYSAMHAPISTDGAPPQPDTEGVAIYYRMGRMEFVSRETVRFNQIAAEDETLLPPQRHRVQCRSHNVAIVATFRDRLSGKTLVLGCVHLFWEWTKPEAQVWHLQTMCRVLQNAKVAAEERGETVSTFLCGDFNCEWENPPMHFLRNGRCDPFAQSFFHEPITHPLAFSSSYEQYFSSDEFSDHVTAVGSEWNGQIDYVFFDPRQWKVCGVVKVESATGECIPNMRVPSDHYPICAILDPL